MSKPRRQHQKSKRVLKAARIPDHQVGMAPVLAKIAGVNDQATVVALQRWLEDEGQALRAFADLGDSEKQVKKERDYPTSVIIPPYFSASFN